MLQIRVHSFLSRVLSLIFACAIQAVPAMATESVNYLILAETVEPIMIVRDDDPMAGGIMTDIVQLIFEDSDYVIEPVVLPWQRMVSTFNESDNWMLHGFPESFGADILFEMSELPVFPFNHSAVTLSGSGLSPRTYEDLHGLTTILVENFQYPGLDAYLASIESGKADARIGVVRAYSPQNALEMLKHKRGDVVIDWAARAAYNLQAADLNIEDVEFHEATQIVPTQNVYLVFSPRMPDEFREFVNDRIVLLSETGQLAEIVGNYSLPSQAQEVN